MALNDHEYAWQPCSDQEHVLFTAVPTMKRLSLRSLLSVAANERFQVHVCDVTKAFRMFQTPLLSPVYTRPRPEMGSCEGKIVKVICSMYGMPEPPVHWFKTYSYYHGSKLEMTHTKLDRCMMYQIDDGNLEGIVGF